MPPLRERKEDLPEIVGFFLKRLNRKLHNAPCESVDPACMDIFRSVSWPGNLRQLEHVMERMMLLGDGARSALADRLIPQDLRAEIEVEAGSRRRAPSARSCAARRRASRKILIEESAGRNGRQISRAQRSPPRDFAQKEACS